MTLDPALVAAAERAEARLRDRLVEIFGTGSPLPPWLDTRFGGQSLAEVFLEAGAYPILRMPWWAASDHLTIDEHAQLAYSSMCGYLFIRIIDDAADGDQEIPGSVLPSVGFFHAEFTDVFRRWFPTGHAFWDVFSSWWFETAAAAVADLAAGPTTRDEFERTAGRKTNAAMIPIAAALHRAGRSDELPRWEQFVIAYGRWHQFQNDIEGLDRDNRSGSATWIISEARARSPAGLSPRGWMWTLGVDWAAEVLDSYAAGVSAAAGSLAVPAVDEYVAERFERWSSIIEDVRGQLASVMAAAGEIDE